MFYAFNTKCKLHNYTPTFNGANNASKEITVWEQRQRHSHSFVNLTGSMDFLQHSDKDFDWQEEVDLWNHVHWCIEHSIPKQNTFASITILCILFKLIN